MNEDYIKDKLENLYIVLDKLHGILKDDFDCNGLEIHLDKRAFMFLTTTIANKKLETNGIFKCERLKINLPRGQIFVKAIKENEI